MREKHIERPRRAASVLVTALAGLGAAAACSDDEAAYEPEIPWIELGSPSGGIPACAPGWLATSAPGRATVCDPWPEATSGECPTGSTRFPGEPGCVAIGSACPAGDFPEDLPTGAPLRYVLAGATGGDGSSPERPMASIIEALNDLEPGTTIVIGRGVYDFTEVALRDGTTLRGACPEATVLRSERMADSVGAISVIEGSSEVRDLSVEAAERPAVMVRWGASVHLAGIVVSRARGAGLLAFGGATLTADGIVVEDTRAWDADTTGAAIHAREGASVTLRRTLVTGTEGLGARAAEEGTRVVVEASTFAGNVIGLGAEDGGALEARGVVVEDATTSGARASGTGSTIVVTDSLVRDRVAPPPGVERTEPARALEAIAGGSLAAVSSWIADVRGLGARAIGAGSMLRIEGSVLSGMRTDETLGAGGVGVTVADGATLELVSSVLEHNAELAASAAGIGSVLRMEDVVVRDTVGAGAAGMASGRGLVAARGAHVEGSRTLFERNRDVTVYAADPGTEITLRHSIVRDALARSCAETTCADAAGGIGVGSYLGSTVRLRRFAVTGSPLCGVQLAEGGTIDLQLGEIAGHPIGACVQDAGYDLDHLTDGVRFRDNGTNLDTTSLPVPDASDPWGE